MAIKPVISYVASKIVPLNEELNTSIVMKKVSKTEYRNWNNKTEFVSYVDTLYVPPTSDTYVFIKCQCGMEHEYASKSEVPSRDLTCECGRKLIEYGN